MNESRKPMGARYSEFKILVRGRHKITYGALYINHRPLPVDLGEC